MLSENPPIILAKQEMQVTLLKISEKLSDYDCKFDIIIVWANEDINKEDIAPIQKVLKYVVDTSNMSSKPEYASVLVIVSPKGSIVNDCPEDVSLMSSEFDLRILEKNIGEILMGSVIKFTNTSTSDKSQEVATAQSS